MKSKFKGTKRITEGRSFISIWSNGSELDDPFVQVGAVLSPSTDKSLFSIMDMVIVKKDGKIVSLDETMLMVRLRQDVIKSIYNVNSKTMTPFYTVDKEHLSNLEAAYDEDDDTLSDVVRRYKLVTAALADLIWWKNSYKERHPLMYKFKYVKEFESVERALRKLKQFLKDKINDPGITGVDEMDMLNKSVNNAIKALEKNNEMLRKCISH